MHRHAGPGRGQGRPGQPDTKAEERTHLCRNLRAQIAERSSALRTHQLLRHCSPKISRHLRAGKKSDPEKVASFGPLCLSADSTRCQLSESLSDFKIRRAVRPDFTLPSGALYFRHYEVGRAPRPWICMALGRSLTNSWRGRNARCNFESRGVFGCYLLIGVLRAI